MPRRGAPRSALSSRCSRHAASSRRRTRADCRRSRGCSAPRKAALLPFPFGRLDRSLRPERRRNEPPSAPQAQGRGELIMLGEKESEIGNVAALGPLGNPPHSKYERLIARAKQVPAATTIVVHPCEETALRGPIEAAQAGIIVPILVGPAAKITAVAREHRLDIDGFEIVDAPHSEAAAAKGVELIHQGKGELLMKGSLHTDELMREVASSKTGLRTARRISHVFIMDVPTHSDTLFITDAAINIFPDLDAKRDIVQNAIDLFTMIGLGMPRVAILSAVETVTPKIPSTIDAAALCKMAERGQITGGILDGPLAFDNAI